MADTKKRQRGKRRERKSIPRGKVFVQSTFNNTIVTITDPNGNALSWSSAGSSAFKGSRKMGGDRAAGKEPGGDPTRRGIPRSRPYDNVTGRGNSGYLSSRNHRAGFEQEFRVSSEPTGRLSWVAGAYYSDLQSDIRYR